MGRVVVVHLNNNYTNFAIILDRPAHVHAPDRFDSGSQTAHTQSHSLSPSNTPFLRNRPHHTAISPFDVDAEVARKTFSFSKGSFSRWDERGERESGRRKGLSGDLFTEEQLSAEDITTADDAKTPFAQIVFRKEKNT